MAPWNATKDQVLPSVSPYSSADKDSDWNKDVEEQESDEEEDEAAI